MPLTSSLGQCLSIAKGGHNLSEVGVAEVEKGAAVYPIAPKTLHCLAVAKCLLLLEKVAQLVQQ